jgi:hypothetical protein
MIPSTNPYAKLHPSAADMMMRLASNSFPVFKAIFAAPIVVMDRINPVRISDNRSDVER